MPSLFNRIWNYLSPMFNSTREEKEDNLLITSLSLQNLVYGKIPNINFTVYYGEDSWQPPYYILTVIKQYNFR